ncbi:dehydrogenase/reductase SDR family member 7 [Aethina tumida]|uniref:dehydrogenase/reductase SDR family member 7 n=1 Tax=Aethina tumida TaxID=116153 RepID=UPI00096B3AF7|nr:dehydrogenase/reductase SDR family member 7 [Aethina tumida]
MLFSVIGFGVFVYGFIYFILTCVCDCDVELKFYELFGKSPRRLKGKVVFVTGASSGIGEHLSYSLAKHGVKLVLAARRNDELQRVKRKCLDLSRGQLNDTDVLVLVMDVTDLQSHKKHFDHAVRHFGKIDVLVNNAGRSQRALWENIEMSVDKQMFELNVFGVVNLSRLAMDHFIKQKSGHIAVVSSLAGVIGVPYSGTYTGSKHAIHGYFNSLRNEKSGQGISVTLLCPGPTFTNFLQESFTEKSGEKYNQTTQPTDRRMTAERCGDLCAISIANKLRESWMGLFPLMPFTYTAVYFPNIFNFALKTVGPQTLFKLRDSKKLELNEGKIH